MLSMIISIILLVIFSLSIHYFQRSYYIRRREKEELRRNFSTAKECFAYFNKEIPEGYVLFHLNGNKKDNRYVNLIPMSRKEMLMSIGKHKNNEKK